MADGGRTGIDERDPMEDLRRSVDESLVPGPPDESDGQPAPPKSGYHDSERHDPPVSAGDTE